MPTEAETAAHCAAWIARREEAARIAALPPLTDAELTELFGDAPESPPMDDFDRYVFELQCDALFGRDEFAV